MSGTSQVNGILIVCLCVWNSLSVANLPGSCSPLALEGPACHRHKIIIHDYNLTLLPTRFECHTPILTSIYLCDEGTQ